MQLSPSRRSYGLLLTAFAAVYNLWGSTYLAIARAFLMIGTRSIAAGAILHGLSQLRNPGLLPARAWTSAAASGILLFGGCHGSLAIGFLNPPRGRGSQQKS